MTRFVSISSLALVLGAALVLSACDAADPDAAPLDTAELSTFSATVVSSAGQTALAGDVMSSDDPNEFQGAFQSHPIRTDLGPFHATVLRLRAASGERIRLGQISPDSLASGTFDIETERNLEPPYGFVAAFRTADGEVLKATSGTVSIELDDRQVAGRFELAFDGDIAVSGTFVAKMARAADVRCRRLASDLRELVDAGEITEEQARRQFAAEGCVSDKVQCHRLAAELYRLVQAGEITQEQARQRLAATGCDVDVEDDRCDRLTAELRRLVDAGDITEEEAQRRLTSAGCTQDDANDRG